MKQLHTFLFNFIKNNDLFAFLSKGIISLLLIFLSSFQITEATANKQDFDSISLRFDSIYYTRGTESKELIREMYQIAINNPDSISLLAKCIHKEAQLSYAQGTIDSTLTQRIREQIQNTNPQDYPYESALLNYALGAYLSSIGNYSEAFSVSLEASESFKALNDSTQIARTLNLLGTICSHISMYGMSNNYYEEALAWTTPDDQEYYRIQHNNYRLSLLDTDMSTIDSMINFTSVIENTCDTSLMISSYLNLGAFYLKVQEFDRAYDCWEKTGKLINEIDNPRFIPSLYQNLGAYYIIRENDYKKALVYFKESIRISKQNQNLIHLSSLYNIVSEVYNEINNDDSAYYYLRKHYELSNQLRLTPKAMEAYQDYVSAYLETTENKLTIAEQEIKIRNRHFIVVLMVAISLILLAILMVIIFQQQKIRKVNENKELSKQLDLEKKIQQIEKEKQNEIIESKTREITSYSLLLSNKNNVLKQILDLNTQLKKNKGNSTDIVKKIDEIIQSNFNVDTEWKDFKMHFDKVHPSFFDKLKNQCNDLTENNLRICAYFRIGMSTKQIAQILHISPSSVSIHRHRLKKKLGLTEEDDLDAFIRNI